MDAAHPSTREHGCRHLARHVDSHCREPTSSSQAPDRLGATSVDQRDALGQDVVGHGHRLLRRRASAAIPNEATDSQPSTACTHVRHSRPLSCALTTLPVIDNELHGVMTALAADRLRSSSARGEKVGGSCCHANARCVGAAGRAIRLWEVMSEHRLVDVTGRLRSPAATPGHGAGRAPNKGRPVAAFRPLQSRGWSGVVLVAAQKQVPASMIDAAFMLASRHRSPDGFAGRCCG
jgi:hypothetical protein